MTNGTCHILGASMGNGQGFRTHDRGKGLNKHLVQPSWFTPLNWRLNGVTKLGCAGQWRLEADRRPGKEGLSGSTKEPRAL